MTKNLSEKLFIVREEGSIYYYLDSDKLIPHRTDGPAVVHPNGTKLWYRYGKLHRDGGPACEYHDGSNEWYRDGKLHREGGPASEWSYGTKAWYHDGLRHREDGPAFVSMSGLNLYYFHNKLYSDVKNTEEWLRLVKLLVVE